MVLLMLQVENQLINHLSSQLRNQQVSLFFNINSVKSYINQILAVPSSRPSARPSVRPSSRPTDRPSSQPSSQPSSRPSRQLKSNQSED